MKSRPYDCFSELLIPSPKPGSTRQNKEDVSLRHPCSGPPGKARQTPQGTDGGCPEPAPPLGGEGHGQLNTGARLVAQHVQALLVKRFHHTVRSRRDFLAQVFITRSLAEPVCW